MDIDMNLHLQKERQYIEDISEKDDGKNITVAGWVYEIRELSKLKFILLRDFSGIVQCVITDKKLMEKISGITLESVVEIKGKIKKANVKAEYARKEIEIEVLDFKILSKSDVLPLQVNEKAVKSELPTRLDWRSIDTRKQNVSAIFKIQSTIINSFRNYFYEKKFIEIQPPSIIATSTEGGTELFEVKYFEKKAYLAQSPQLYKQLMAISWEKVFSTSAVWRAEKHDTARHINEIRQMDIECAFHNDIEIMKHLEESVAYIIKKIIEKNQKELEILGINLKIPKGKYLAYKDAVEILNKNNFKMKQGDDFDPEAERRLCNLFPSEIVFTYEWPISLKPFYIWPKNKKDGISGGFDALYGGVEISSGGQRVHDPEILSKQIKEKGLNPKNFEWYINSFKYGAPYHAGWSIGLERFTQAILGLGNIREATLFPRDRKRLTP